MEEKTHCFVTCTSPKRRSHSSWVMEVFDVFQGMINRWIARGGTEAQKLTMTKRDESCAIYRARLIQGRSFQKRSTFRVAGGRP